jgi:hypothetical protein
MSEKKRKMLEDLGNLWESTVDLIERQEHSAQKEGGPIMFEDGRRVVRPHDVLDAGVRNDPCGARDSRQCGDP